MKYYGQFETDKIIEAYFPDQNTGFCIDIGAADGVRGSNTYLFEKKGWHCLCVEANPFLASQAEEVRDSVWRFACGRKPSKEEKFTVYNIGKRKILTSISGLKPDMRLINDNWSIINDVYDILVEVITLDILLESYRSKLIDFISIDTEGTEMDVLEGFTFENHDVKLFIIENNYDDPELVAYMRNKGYVRDQRYKINDFYVKA